MGLLSKVWKGFKNIFSGVGNFFKSAFSSKNIWKTVAVGAGVYFGGAALGYWDSPILKSINGKWADSALGSKGTLGKWLGVDSATKSTERLREANAADSMLPQTPSAPRGSAFVDSSTPIGQSSPVSVQAPAYVSSAAKDAAESTGIVGQAMDKVGEGWDYLAGTKAGKGVAYLAKKADEHPFAASMAFKAVSGMTADEPYRPETGYEKEAGVLLARNENKKNFEVGTSPAQRERGLVGGGMIAGDASAQSLHYNRRQVNAPITPEEAARRREEELLKQEKDKRYSQFAYT